jgi:hypothetical protein
MHKNTTKCNETLSKWCKNKHGSSKIIDTFETYQEHDAKSVSGDIVSAKPVDDKPVVLVSDKPVEFQPHIDEGKDMSACVPLPVHVDMGVQTDDGAVDCVLLHMVPRVVSHSFVTTPQNCFVGAAVRVHKGKDGCVCQLCGPGITTLQGRA